jgi:hypothetical protein
VQEEVLAVLQLRFGLGSSNATGGARRVVFGVRERALSSVDLCDSDFLGVTIQEWSISKED